MSEHTADLDALDALRERLRRPPCWGPNEHGDMMVDLSVETYERELDLLVQTAKACVTEAGKP